MPDKEALIDEVVNMIMSASDEKLQEMINKYTKEGQLYMRDILLMEQNNRWRTRQHVQKKRPG